MLLNNWRRHLGYSKQLHIALHKSTQYSSSLQHIRWHYATPHLSTLQHSTYPLFICTERAIAGVLHIPELIEALSQAIWQNIRASRIADAEHDELYDQQEQQQHRVLQRWI